nr:MAG TPA: hypothetical protein [Caudoviricetes sp.]
MAPYFLLYKSPLQGSSSLHPLHLFISITSLTSAFAIMDIERR